MPIPGSPAISTTCPPTNPPPKTLSNSIIFVEILETFFEGIEVRLMGLLPVGRCLLEVDRPSETIVSTNDPQLPQFGHFPAQPT